MADRLAQARHLMKQHGLSSWTLAVDRAKARAGVCKHGSSTISLSRTYVRKATDEQFVDTVLHEIAHALAGPDEGHGPRWRDIALSIGCSGARCVDAFATPKYVIECPCGAVCVRRHRVSTALLRKVCKACRGPLRGRRAKATTADAGRPEEAAAK